MSKLSLLKEYIKLIVETQQAPFSLSGHAVLRTPGRRASEEYTIYREFPLVATPEMMQHLQLTPDDLDEDGTIPAENEIVIEVTNMHHERAERQTREHPGNPESYTVEGWEPLSLNGLALSPDDAKKLKSYMGDLTEEENDAIIEQYMDSHEPDFDDGGYF